MKKSQQIVLGLTILSQRDDTDGDVSMDYERGLYAGPQDEETLAQMPPHDIATLESLGWEFNDQVGRWMWRA